MNCPRTQMRCAQSASFCRPSGARKPRCVARRAPIVAAALEEIDPNTGLPYDNASTRTVKPRPMLELTIPHFAKDLYSDTVVAGGLRWAYRQSKADENSTADKPTVLLLHGIGSNSYSYRNLMRLLSDGGHDCYAPDWPGHGSSEKPTSGFAYDAEAYVNSLDEFVKAAGISGPLCVITHGFVLGQYGLLWALKRRDDIEKLVIMSTPLGLKTPLRPELAPFKSPLPFLRPKPDAKFAADLFNASGLAYVINYDDAQAYDIPYQEEPEANLALFETMDKLDWKKLLAEVDEGFRTWRNDSVILYGNKDEFLDIRGAIQWLDSKRTAMKLISVEGKLGHMPQEDFSEAFSPILLDFFDGVDVTITGTKKFRKSDL